MNEYQRLAEQGRKHPGERTDLKCGECGAPMKLRASRYGLFYGCTRYPECRGTHGAHKDGSPLGTPADTATKQARMKAHAAFDPMWKGDGAPMTRGDAYRWLQEQLNLSPDECHIGKFTIDQCKRVLAVVGAGLEYGF